MFSDLAKMSFSLDENFVKGLPDLPNVYSGNPLGEVVYKRTYSRVKDDGTNEEWWETIKRVVEGTYSIQKNHIEHLRLGWSDEQAQRSAQEMYMRMYIMKFLPPGRGLAVQGTRVVIEKGGAALNNCGAITTANIATDPVRPFTFLMDMSMLGVGIGADTKGSKISAKIYKPSQSKYEKFHTIADSREGWVESLKLLLESFFYPNKASVSFDYSKIRKEGARLKTFGGISSGPQPLVDMHEAIRKILSEPSATTITSTIIVDIFNLIGVCVVSGGVRRSAEIMFGEHDDKEFRDLKNYEVNPHRMAYGWTSNNSIFAQIGMDYTDVAKTMSINGEPGLVYLENMQAYGRMCDPPNNKDHRATLTNPCSEQTLETHELCCVSGDTRILTKNGYPYIKDVVGKPVEVWNGRNWSLVNPYVAGRNKRLYRVLFTDGSFLDVTDNHNWSVRGTITDLFVKKDTLSLLPGDTVEPFNIYECNPDVKGLVEYTINLHADGGFPTALFTASRDSILRALQPFLNPQQPVSGLKNNIRLLQLLFNKINYKTSTWYSLNEQDGMTDEVWYITRRYDNNLPQVRAVNLLPEYHTTYCFTEDERHMGVFGNHLTYQCLVETFPARHDDKEDFLRTLKFAYLYAKTVTLVGTHIPETNRVMLRNRRIGTSVSGIAQFLGKHSIDELRHWLDNGYDTIQFWDKVYSEWFCVPHSIKTTSVKPSGTVSILAGATPGVHYPESKYYIRRVRMNKHSPLLKSLIEKGHHVEPCVGLESTTDVVEFPVYIGEVRTLEDVTMFEQLEMAAFMQHWWSDNQISCTVTFDPETEGPHIASALNTYQYRMKGISFLPRLKSGTAYPQMPYESITKEKYEELVSKINNDTKLENEVQVKSNALPDAVMYCDGQHCTL